MKIALLCGGPSPERGISLNSARSVCDHLHSEAIEVSPLYFDHHKNAYRISRGQLYSNTPSDFDFKLKTSAKPLSEKALIRFLKEVDLVFPAMHGAFGEDGEIQRFLEKNGIPFVGSSSEACKRAFDKHQASAFLETVGFPSVPNVVLKIYHDDHRKILEGFFRENRVRRAVVKPATGGSSIGVYSVETVEEALEKSHLLFSRRLDTRVVVEPFCEGTEFTVVLLENRFGLPVALLPTEIEIDYREGQLFDTRKKYLATRQVAYHCPPRFGDAVVERIQVQAEQLFRALGMRDFARFDGWLLKDGSLRFSDFNPISGMEQNSFLFLQAAQLGMSHRDVLLQVIRNACRRYQITSHVSSLTKTDFRLPLNVSRHTSQVSREPQTPQSIFYPPFAPQLVSPSVPQQAPRLKVSVLFGGSSSERQVSVMSGTNVWLKLRKSSRYDPHPYLLDTHHQVWRLPYAFTLNHTVEEIAANCERAAREAPRLKRLRDPVLEKLALRPGEASEDLFLPSTMTLEDFINRSSFVFIGLHGGIGEDGTLQKMLEKAGVPFNGSGSDASRLCMDKFATAQALQGLENQGILTAAQTLEPLERFSRFKDLDYKRYWKKLHQELGAPSVIVKPRGDGCSSGIARLYGWMDLKTYANLARARVSHIPIGTLTEQHGLIQMPTEPMDSLLFEPFVVTDRVRVAGKDLHWDTKTEWIEITMGVLEEGGRLRALSPSLTVAEGNVLTLEEKFQGGTGINITPPPAPFVKPSAIKKAKARMETVAKRLGIRGYARIDAFMHVRTGELMVIEANTVPGLTPSTVIYHQALAETPPLTPTEFLERVVESGISANQRNPKAEF